MNNKQCRQLNRYTIKTSSAANFDPSSKQNFISYSSHLRKKEEQQMKILQKIDYRYSIKSAQKNDSNLLLFLKQKGKEETHSQKLLEKNITSQGLRKNDGKRRNEPSHKKKAQIQMGKMPKKEKPETKEQYQWIDSSAVVIKGKLIYLKQEASQKLSNDELLYLLKQNKISNKEYLMGNREQILEKISSNQSAKQNQIINDYILRSMSEQNNGEVNIMDRFYEVKDSLFD